MRKKLFGTPAEEDFNYSAWMWFQVTLVAVAITVLFFFCGGIVVVMQNGPAAQQQVAQAFAPFFLGAAGIVTFCGAVWRGKLNSEQIKQQTRQNNSSEDANYAKLLQEGARMIGDDTKRHDQLAGIASLDVVILEPRRRFAAQALDIVASFYLNIISNTSADEDGEFEIGEPAEAARRSLIRAADAGLRSTLDAYFSGPDESAGISWPAVCGFRTQFYQYGGIIYDEALQTILRDQCHFENTEIRGNLPPNLDDFFDCMFRFCRVSKIDPSDNVTGNKFRQCDFSGALFEGDPIQIAENVNLFSELNWYDIDNPPVHPNFSDWSSILVAKRHNESGKLVTVAADGTLHEDDLAYDDDLPF